MKGHLTLVPALISLLHWQAMLSGLGVWAALCREVSADHGALDLAFMGREQCLALAWALPHGDVWGNLACG